MSYEFKKVSDMNETHLLNTIGCDSQYINEARKNKCRLQLIKMWSKKFEKSKKFKQKFKMPLQSKPIDIPLIVNSYL